MNRKLWLYQGIRLQRRTDQLRRSLLARARKYRSEEVFAISLLSVLAIVAELLGFVLPNSARGSIAFIPYLACCARCAELGDDRWGGARKNSSRGN